MLASNINIEECLAQDIILANPSLNRQILPFQADGNQSCNT
jgi:hypothetical protein